MILRVRYFGSDRDGEVQHFVVNLGDSVTFCDAPTKRGDRPAIVLTHPQEDVVVLDVRLYPERQETE